MSIRFTGPCQVHLHWVRETPSRVLAMPVSTTLSSARALPERIEHAVRSVGRRSVELHLPFYSAAQDEPLDSWAEKLRFRVDSWGRITGAHCEDPDPMLSTGLQQATVLVWRAMSGDETPCTIAAEPDPGGILPAPEGARRSCEPEGGLSGSPALRMDAYREVYRPLALELQRIAREWVPAQYLRSLDDLDDRGELAALLAWSACRPQAGMTLDGALTDVLDEASMQRALLSIRRSFGERLRVLSSAKTVAASAAIAASYSHLNAARLLQGVQRGGIRYLRQLFHAEGRLIHTFLRFCGRMPDWREAYDADPVRATRGLHREVRESLHECMTVARHLYQKRSQGSLLNRFLVEAVRTMEIRCGARLEKTG